MALEGPWKPMPSSRLETSVEYALFPFIWHTSLQAKKPPCVYKETSPHPQEEEGQEAWALGLWDFGPSSPSGKEPACWCRRHNRCGLHSWVGKIPWRRACHHTPVFWPGESPRTEEPDGVQSIGSHRVGHDWSNLAPHSFFWNLLDKIAFLDKYKWQIKFKICFPDRRPALESFTVALKVSVLFELNSSSAP